MEIPDYHDPIYELDAEFAEQFKNMSRWPSWRRRRWMLETKECKRFLYRYQDFDQRPGATLSMKKAADIIVGSKLYLASPDTFNDPYEFQAVVTHPHDPVKHRKHLEKVAKKYGKNQKERSKLVRQVLARSRQNPFFESDTFLKTREHFGVACLGMNPRQMLMWSLYSAGHTGICFQFDTAEELAIFGCAFPVDYQDEMARLVWPDDRRRIVSDVLLRKWKGWELEGEVRYTSHSVVNRAVPINPNSLRGIILGGRFPENSMPALDEMLRIRRNKGYPAVRLYRADRFRDRYGIYIRRINANERILLTNAH